jgi:dTDP-4-amino-4,6-dideoxygalactose transaminase
MNKAGLGQHIVLPNSLNQCGHVWNQFTIRVPGGQRDSVRQKLADAKIGSEIYYPIPLHRQACFAYLGYEKGSLPITEKLSNEVLSLPIFPELQQAEIESVVNNLSRILQGSGETLLRASA